VKQSIHNIISISYLAIILTLLCFASCASEPEPLDPTIRLRRFAFLAKDNPGLTADAVGVIDHARRTILVLLDAEDVDALVPVVEASGIASGIDGWDYDPAPDQDLSEIEVYYLFLNSADGFSRLGYEVTIAPSSGDRGDVALARQYLEVGYASGDTESSVTLDITLTGSWTNGCTITWESDSTNIVITAENGAVTRPPYNPSGGLLPVVLTATISKGDISATKAFVLLLVPDNVRWIALQAALATLEIEYAPGDSTNSVTQNFTLPGSWEGFNVTWVSGPTNCITAAGVVTRPSWTSGDTPATLTATLREGDLFDTKNFNFTIKRDDTYWNQVQDTMRDIQIVFAQGDSAVSVTQDITLTFVDPVNGCAIAWESSQSTTIGIGGSVARPRYTEGDQTVTLTVTVSKMDVTDTKTFTLTVLRDTTHFDNVQSALAALGIGYAMGDDADSITLNVTLATTMNGCTITWSSAPQGYISASGVVTRPLFTIGDKVVTLTATVTSLDVTEHKTFDLTVKHADITDLEKVQLDLADLAIGYANGDSASKITQGLDLATAGPQGTTISWASSPPGYIHNDGTITRPTYTEGDKTITLTATAMAGTVTQNKVFSNLFMPKCVPTSPIEKIGTDKDNLTIGYAAGDSQGSVTQDLTLVAVGTNAGVTITWESDNHAYITDDGVVVMRPPVGQTNAEVTLTATISCEGVTDTKEFDLTVRAFPPPLWLFFEHSDFEGPDPAPVTALNGTVFTYASGANEFYSGNGGSRSLHVTGSLSANNPLFTVSNCSPKTNSTTTNTKISFWLKGTATGKSLSFRTPMSVGTNYWNLKNVSSSGATINTNGSGAADYVGTFALANWVKITLNIPSAVYPASLEVRGGSGGSYNFYIDDLIYE